MNEKMTDSSPGRRRTWRWLLGLSIACAIVAAGATVLWARPPKPAKAATPKSAGAPAVLRLTASALAGTDLGTAEPSDWSEPPVLRSEDKKLQATLRVAYADNTIKIGKNESKDVHLRSYNGMLTGPTLRVKAGDTLYVKLQNALEEKPTAPMEMKGECAIPTHGFNVTNLHTHGLHISPKDPSDNVLRTVKPGDSAQYEFPILPAGNPEPKPARQYPGTFWYHAHNHGSTAMQLASGMAGALIVEDGPADIVPEVQAAKERLFIFQQFAYDSNGVIEDFTKLSKNWFANKRRTAINGRIKPLIKMRRGEVERWRFIDSGVFSDLPISIVTTKPGPNFAMYRIAIDGITRPAPERVARLELGPGYRTDLLVKAPAESGTYYLYKDRSTQFSLAGTGEPLPVDEAQILAQIEVTPDVCTPPSCATGIPAKLRPPTDMLPNITREQLTRLDPVKVKFELKDNKFFTINETCFDINAARPEFTKKLGEAEQWEILNYTAMPHPFHIHVNAFQLLDENGNPGEWHDTILVPPIQGSTPGRVRFRTRYERFDGKFVLHCHILPHEDEGMMQLVEIRK